uniref:Uncharacterized protein n=1 Tax=Arundo donax TaxID=35708 RepID=A0A0A9D800_ARUDO
MTQPPAKFFTPCEYFSLPGSESNVPRTTGYLLHVQNNI